MPALHSTSAIDGLPQILSTQHLTPIHGHKNPQYIPKQERHCRKESQAGSHVLISTIVFQHIACGV